MFSDSRRRGYIIQRNSGAYSGKKDTDGEASEIVAVGAGWKAPSIFSNQHSIARYISSSEGRGEEGEGEENSLVPAEEGGDDEG